MPCDLGASLGGTTYSGGSWVSSTQYTGTTSPNCAALNSGDLVGTLVSSGTTPGYNATTGLLEVAGWPGTRTFASAEFQVMQRWQQTVDDCASLGFNGRRIAWAEFLEALTRAVDETLFAPESQDAPILIAGPAESAGLTADAIWFLGANQDAWPAGGPTHPLLPLPVQRDAGMPHASAQLDWDLAAVMTRRLLASTAEIRFSCARQSEGVERKSVAPHCAD